MDPRPLPLALQGTAFTILGGTLAGASKSRMLRSDLTRPTYGVRRDGPATTLTELAAATALALPGDVAFCFSTAAGLLDLPLPTTPHPCTSCAPAPSSGSGAPGAWATSAWSGES